MSDNKLIIICGYWAEIEACYYIESNFKIYGCDCIKDWEEYDRKRNNICSLKISELTSTNIHHIHKILDDKPNLNKFKLENNLQSMLTKEDILSICNKLNLEWDKHKLVFVNVNEILDILCESNIMSNITSLTLIKCNITHLEFLTFKKYLIDNKIKLRKLIIIHKKIIKEIDYYSLLKEKYVNMLSLGY